MSFKTSVLIWFSRFRGTTSPQPNRVRLLCETEGQKDILFNDISFEDRVEERNTKDYRNRFTCFETSGWYIKLEDVFN